MADKCKGIKSYFIKLKFLNHFQELQNQVKLLLLIIKLIKMEVNPINPKMRILNSVVPQIRNGNIITRIKKDIMALLLNFQNMLNKVKNQNNLIMLRKYGSNIFFQFRPNFNGTSKNFQETLAKPCPAPSQLKLNEIRRNH
jgi:hypothetical protein